jgi:RNA polymerase sigma-70 factor (ECF subfamily)
MQVRLTEVNGLLGVAAWVDGEPFVSISPVVEDGRIDQVLVVANPDKLAGLGAPPSGTP